MKLKHDENAEDEENNNNTTDASEVSIIYVPMIF